jgi:KUP system potassium uptake protein
MTASAAEHARASSSRERGGEVSSGLVLAALGVVFGDIGTSPLYALKTCFTTAHVAPTTQNVLGIISLVFWALVVVVCVKYVGILMRIDHDGEGGILALLALASPPRILGVPIRADWLVWVVVVGAAMLFGDGIITPSISVISAVEGLGMVTTHAQPLIVPISLAILIGLFVIQARGTQRVGSLFGPVMAIWFLAIAALGIAAIARRPQVLAALDPRHAVAFVVHHGIFGFLVFGAVVLCITGVEALYADLSHFGRRPIQYGWYAVVFPALTCNYFGQGALLLSDPHALDNPFFALTAGWALVPMVVLATAATVIASQALISGAFTLAEQAVALNLWPRLQIDHTSNRRPGEVYVPMVNWALAVGCVVLTVVFRSSERLAAAYGLAVAGTMLATSIAFYVVVTKVMHWKKRVALPLFVCFALIDGTFLLAGLPKFLDGAWIPLAIAAVLLTIAMTWLEGRRCVSKTIVREQLPVEQLIELQAQSTLDPPGTMVFFTGDPSGVPFVNKHRWVSERAKRERVVLLTLVRAARPYVVDGERVVIEEVAPRVVKVSAAFGYMERPRIEPILRACKAGELHLDDDETSFFYGDPKIVKDATKPLPRWQRHLFMYLLRNARPIPDELGISAQRRVLLGLDVPI